MCVCVCVCVCVCAYNTHIFINSRIELCGILVILINVLIVSLRFSSLMAKKFTRKRMPMRGGCCVPLYCLDEQIHPLHVRKIQTFRLRHIALGKYLNMTI